MITIQLFLIILIILKIIFIRICNNINNKIKKIDFEVYIIFLDTQIYYTASRSWFIRETLWIIKLLSIKMNWKIKGIVDW